MDLYALLCGNRSGWLEVMPARHGRLECDHVEPVVQFVAGRSAADDALTKRLIGTQQSITEHSQFNSRRSQNGPFYAEHERLVPDRVACLSLRRCLLAFSSGGRAQFSAVAAASTADTSHYHRHAHKWTFNERQQHEMTLRLVSRL